MPGIHFIHSLTDLPREHLFNAALDALCHDRDYQRENVYRDKSAMVGVTRYSEYPLAVYGNDDYSVLLEGFVYDIDDRALENTLLSLAPSLFEDSNADTLALETWLKERDGEYTILARQDRTGEWAFLNDPLARLPVYFCQEGDRSFLSREVRFILPFLKRKELDRMAVAQQLLFEYPLGSRTLYGGIESVPPATLVRWNKVGNIQRRSFDQHNFERHQGTGSVKAIAERLADSFVTACRRRASTHGECVIGLSGGHDSRAVAAGLRRADVDFRAVTFELNVGGNKADVEVSQQVASALRVERKLLTLTSANGRDVRELLSIKGGLNYLAVAFGIPYLRTILREYGRNIVYFTGDGGHQVMPNLLPTRRIEDVSQLVNFAIQRNHVVPLEMVSAITGIDAAAITEDLATIFESFPERSRRYKYIRFHLYGRALRWLHEGEDRNRCFFWSTTPFYASPFFSEAMAVPPTFKRNHRLYCEFLRVLSPDMVRIVDANRGIPVSSPKYRLMMAAISFLNKYPALLRRIRSRMHPVSTFDPHAAVVQCLQNQIRSSDKVSEYFELGQLKTLMERPESISREGLYNLFTIISIVERFLGDGDSMRQFENDAFE